MARTEVAKPLVSRGYGKIVALTLLAMLIGIGLMAVEIFGDYGGDISAVRKPPVKVPSSLPPAEKGGPVAPPTPVPPVPPPDGP